MALEAYRNTQKTAETPRAEEYRRLAELSVALTRAEKSGDVNARARALLDNQRFWAGLRLSMMSAVNSLPAELRAQFVGLAGWVERETVLASLGHSKLDNLIAVNRQIMEGLKPYQGSVKEDSLEII